VIEGARIASAYGLLYLYGNLFRFHSDKASRLRSENTMVNQASGTPRKPVTLLRLRQVGTTEHTGEVVLQLLRETPCKKTAR